MQNSAPFGLRIVKQLAALAGLAALACGGGGSDAGGASTATSGGAMAGDGGSAGASGNSGESGSSAAAGSMGIGGAGGDTGNTDAAGSAGSTGGAEAGGTEADSATTASDVTVSATDGAADSAVDVVDGGGIFPILGDWVGTTSQNENILFTVTASGLSNLTVFYDAGTCSAGLGQIALDGRVVAPIENGAFKSDVTRTSGTPLGTYSVAGAFESTSTASGTLRFALTAITPSDCGGSGTATWTAAPKGDAGIPCRLKRCAGTTSPSFSYSCGTGTVTRMSQTSSSSATLTVSFGDGHVVRCETASGDAGWKGTCSDNTGASCSW